MTDLELLTAHPELLQTPMSDGASTPDDMPLGWRNVEDCRRIERLLNVARFKLAAAEKELKMYRNMVGPREREMVRTEMGGLAA